MEFVIPDVAASMIMDVAKVVATAVHPLKREDIVKCFSDRYSSVYITNAISAASQLFVIEEKEGVYISPSKVRDLIKRAHRKELYIPFRTRLQDYPPFLLYAQFVAKGYSSDEAASILRGIFYIKGLTKVIERSLRRWGLYSGLLEKVKTGKIKIKISMERLTAEYVKDLLEALESDMKAKLFIIDRLGAELFGYITSKGLSITELATAIREYEKDPRGSANKACQVFETFLYKVGEDAGIDVSRYTGVIQLTDAMRGANKILRKHMHVCHGLGGIRNASSHGPDQETGNPWRINPDTALVSAIFVPVTMRSLYLFIEQGKQEF